MNVSHSRPPETVIQVKDLVKSYGRTKAVAGISFEVTKSEIFGFLGPNGAGKTTTLNVLEGLGKADQGQVKVLGMNVNTMAGQIKRRIGVQLQSTSLLPDLTIIEQIELFAGWYKRPIKRHEAMTLLERVGLVQKAKTFPDRLSGGQKQRLALALALVNDPKILFLDEPTTGLDPQSRRALWDLIRELQSQDKTIVLTTHYMEEAEALCHRVGIIDQGRLIALDTPAALINRLAGLSSITTTAHLSPAEIQTLPHVVASQRNSTLLHIQTSNVMATLESMLDLAKSHKINLNDLHIKQPSLEDVFLDLTGHAIRN